MTLGRSGAELQAREWLLDHPDSNEAAGMEDLQKTNPDAFAIVQALLTKKSLGLLNPKHPDAFGGFSGTPVATPDAAPAAPEVPLAAVATETTHSIVNTGNTGNFFNWKPHEDDDSMVSNVLGAVAGLEKGRAQAPVEAAEPMVLQHHKAEMVAIKSVAPPTSSEQTPPSAASAPQPVKAAAKVAAKVPEDSSNKYQEDLGSTVETTTTKPEAAPAPKASMSQTNSYLTNLGFTATSAGKTPNALAGFSWTDDDDTQKVSLEESSKTDVTPQRTNPLTSWLNK